MPRCTTEPVFDAIIVGSGVGGAMAAHRLIHAGWRVLMLERGTAVARGPGASDPSATLELTPHFSTTRDYHVDVGGYKGRSGAVFCLGGASIYYGAAAVRFREADFVPAPEISARSSAVWPYRYADLEPYYGEAERIMGVAGDDEGDPTRPPRRSPFPQPPAPLTAAARRFGDAARALGLNPVRLPLAVNYDGANGRRACTSCRTCDTYACSVEAKNDMDAGVIAPLTRRGLQVRLETLATRLATGGDGAVASVHAWDRSEGRPVEFRGRYVLLAAGALGTPRLLLASGLDRVQPAGRAVGKYLTRHCSAMVFGFCSDRFDPDHVFHKQLIILDYYFGDPRSWRHHRRRLGSIQQVTTPPAALIANHLPEFFRRVPLSAFTEHLAGALVLAEDEPRDDNGVALDPTVGGDGLPRLRIRHTYTRADLRRRAALVRRAKRVLRRCGAFAFYTHKLRTFSHALGTVRMGPDASTAPLDGDCRFRGLRNLLVVDGSALPTAAGVNPALTIAANALRAADRLVQASE